MSARSGAQGRQVVPDAAPGQFWMVRVSKRGRKMIGKVSSVLNDIVRLHRVTSDGDLFSAHDELNAILCSPVDLVAQLEMDNFYGMLVPFGTKKKHVCNGNSEES